MESTTLKWNGDVDLNDGKLQEQYRVYRQQLDFVKTLGLGGKQKTSEELQKASMDIAGDLDFIHSGNCMVVQVHMVETTFINATLHYI